MTKYKYTPSIAQPQQGANTAHFDKDMTARLGLDGSKSNYGYYNLTLPVILLTFMMVSCLPAHAVTNSAFEMRLQAYPQSDTPYNSERLKKGGYQTEATFTQSQDDFIKSNLDHCNKNNQTEATFSPYLGTFSVPQNVKADFLHTLGTEFLQQYTHALSKASLDFSEQYAHARAKESIDFLHTLRVSTFFNIKKPSNDRQMKKTLTSNRGQGYDVDLSQKQIAVKPSRYLLAIFVPANWSSSQLHQPISTNHFTHSQGKTVISMVSKSPTTYDGAIFGECKSLLGKYPKAATICAESEPRHPMTFHSVALTQKQIGGQNHA